jgi:hypothetical protein
MSSTAKNPVKIDLATIDQNLKQLNLEINKAFSVLDKGTKDIRQFLSIAKTLKIDSATINELSKQRETLKSLGVPPNANIDFAIENAEIITDIVNQVNKSLSAYLSSIQGYDVG